MRLTPYVIVATILALAGCSGPARKSQSQEAKDQWNQTRAAILVGLAKDQYANGNLDKCKETVDSAMKMDPMNAQLHILSAKLSIEKSELEAAQRSLDVARTLDPKNGEADYLSGVIYQRWQQPETSLAYYTAASDKAPAELPFVMARAEMLVVVGKPEQALALLQEKAAYFEHSGTLRDAAGQLLVREGKYEQAIDLFRQAAVLSDDLSIREHLAVAQYQNKQYREAADGLERLTKNEAFARRADLVSVLGECQMELGKYREARSSFETAAQLNPGSPAVWLSFGKVALQLGDLPRAELALKKAAAIDPTSSEVSLMLGYIRLKQNKLNESLTAFKQAYQLDQKDTVSLCMVGYVLDKLGHHEQAMKCYARALQIAPNDEMASGLMAAIGSQAALDPQAAVNPQE